MKVKFTLSTIVFILGISGCSSSSITSQSVITPVSSTAHSVLNREENQVYKTEFEKWAGTPYKYGGSTKQGIDCSAFVQSVILSAQQKALPRTTEKQSQSGIKIDYANAKSGDLVFFKTNLKDKHVGIFIGGNQFMHASTSKGVIISRLDNPYWASVFWQVRRIN